MLDIRRTLGQYFAKRAQRGLTPLRPSQFFYTNNSPDAAESETLHLSQISEIVAPLEDSP